MKEKWLVLTKEKNVSEINWSLHVFLNNVILPAANEKGGGGVGV